MTSTWPSLTMTVNSSSSSDAGGSDLAQSLWIFSAPVIFVVGICGNALVLWSRDGDALVLVVMRRPRMSGTTTSAHLSVMAVADTLVLVSGLVTEWLEEFTGGDIIFKRLHPVTCKLEKFVFYTR